MPTQEVPDHLSETIARNILNGDHWILVTVADGEGYGGEQKPRIVMRGMHPNTLEKAALELFREARIRREMKVAADRVNRNP